jgi:hypothetical protein
MQIRLGNVRTDIEPHHCTGVFSFFLNGSIRTWNDRISSIFPGDYQWLDVSDGDLNAPVSVLASDANSSNEVVSCCWSSRGIENMLLHPTCALWFVQNEPEVASSRFREIFQRMSLNFFDCSGLNAHSIVSCSKNAGQGWKGWQDVTFEQSKDHSMIGFVKQVIGDVLVSGNRVGSSLLVLYELFREVGLVSEVEKDQKAAVRTLLPKYARIFDLISKADSCSFEQELHQIASITRSKTEDGCQSMWRMEEALLSNEEASMLLCAQKGSSSRVPKEARAAFWQRNTPAAVGGSPGLAFFIYVFPRFLCFLNSFCCAEGIDASVRKASRLCACAVFRVLCATPFGMADDKHVKHEGLIPFCSNPEPKHRVADMSRVLQATFACAASSRMLVTSSSTTATATRMKRCSLCGLRVVWDPWAGTRIRSWSSCMAPRILVASVSTRK